MARKEKIVNVIDGGVSKSFKIRQFSATQGERVKFKLMLLLGADTDLSKLQTNDDNPTALASTMLNAVANKPYEKVQELLDEVLSCISIVTDGNIETQLTPELVDGFIDEASTLTSLRGEVIKFNNFFPQNGSSGSNEFPAPEVTIKRQK
jgi:hypothetical protein